MVQFISYKLVKDGTFEELTPGELGKMRAEKDLIIKDTKNRELEADDKFDYLLLVKDISLYERIGLPNDPTASLEADEIPEISALLLKSNDNKSYRSSSSINYPREIGEEEGEVKKIVKDIKRNENSDERDNGIVNREKQIEK